MDVASTPVAAQFEWIEGPAGRGLQACDLAAYAQHLFTTRAFMAISPDDVRAGLSQVLGLPPSCLVRVRQVHGAEVVVVTPNGVTGGPDADGLVSIDPARGIAVAVADCVPVLLADRRRRVVAAVHAGWRGTVAGVTGAVVQQIAETGVAAADLVAAIGPSIGPCCYQVDAPVRDAFLTRSSRPGAWFVPDGEGRWKLDLWEANRSALIEAGVPSQAIHVARLCTFHHPDLCHSFRRDGARSGRLYAAIRLSAASG
jgi:YfiH family protein